MKYIYLSLFMTSFVYPTEVDSLPSFQGFRGAINTPNSEVMKEGELESLYTNQIENISGVTSPDFRDNKEQKNFFLNMGVLPNLDLNFQYAYGFDDVANEKHLSNRVLSAKYQVPFIPNNLFNMAIGVQDIGGGNPYIGNKYAVLSKEFSQLRTNLGYAIGNNDGSINGIFGSIEYQPLSWLQLVGEYDSKEWNGAIKSEYTFNISKQKVNLGVMAKSSLDYNDVYFGLYANMPFSNKSLAIEKSSKKLFSKLTIDSLKLSNSHFERKENEIYFEYENNLYVYNDIDTLGVVLGVLSTIKNVNKIQVAIKKSNIIQYVIEVDTKEYKQFLKDGIFHSNLLQFKKEDGQKELNLKNSDRFKPLLTLQPDFVLVDGSEYSDVMDYTLAMQAELSMRLAKGTIISGRYNIPLTQSFNFEKNGIFDYRNRDKVTAEVDQILLTQYLNIDTVSYPWTTVLQAGLFDKELKGVSIESRVSDKSGKHQLLFKVANLDDSLADMDKYSDDKREERLLSYRYYLETLNSNIKLTAGQFLYGDKGEAVSFERYFNDLSLRFDLLHSTHDRKGTNNLAKLTLVIPFGTTKRIKTDYLDIEGGEFIYEKRKTLVGMGSNSYALPHHLKEIKNNFTLEKHYLDRDRFHPTYIKNNYNRLRNIYLSTSSMK